MALTTRVVGIRSTSPDPEWALLGVLTGSPARRFAFLHGSNRTVALESNGKWEGKCQALEMHNRKVHFASVVEGSSGFRHLVVCSLRNRNFWTCALMTPGSSAAALVDLTVGFDSTVAVACGQSTNATKGANRDFFTVDDCACTASSLVLLISPRREGCRSLLVSSKASPSWHTVAMRTPLPRDGIAVLSALSSNSIRLSALRCEATAEAPKEAEEALSCWQAPSHSPAQSDAVGQHRAVLTDFSVVIDASGERCSAPRTLASGAWQGSNTIDAACHVPDGDAIAFCVGFSHVVIASTKGAAVHELPFPGGRPSVGCVLTKDGAVAAVLDQRTGALFLGSSWSSSVQARLDLGGKMLGDTPRNSHAFRVALDSSRGFAVSCGTQMCTVIVDGELPRRPAAEFESVRPLPQAAATVAPPKHLSTMPLAEWLRAWCEATTYNRVADDAGRAQMVADRSRIVPPCDADRSTAWIADAGVGVLSREARSTLVPPATKDSAVSSTQHEWSRWLRDMSACADDQKALTALLAKQLDSCIDFGKKSPRVIDAGSFKLAAATAKVTAASVVHHACSLHHGDTTGVSFDCGLSDCAIPCPQITDGLSISPALIDVLALDGELGLAALVAVVTGRSAALKPLFQLDASQPLEIASESVAEWFAPLASSALENGSDALPLGWADPDASVSDALRGIEVTCGHFQIDRRAPLRSLCLIAWITCNDPRTVESLTGCNFRRAVLLLAAWIWAARVTHEASKSAGALLWSPSARSILEGACSWWSHASDVIDVSALLQGYAGLCREPEHSSITPDQVVGVLALRPIALACYISSCGDAWEKVRKSESTPDELMVDRFLALSRGLSGILVRSEAVRDVALTLGESAKSEKAVENARRLLESCLGEDADAREKLRFNKLPPSIAVMGCERVITPPELASFAIAETGSLCKKLWPRAAAVEALGVWSEAMTPIESTSEFHEWLKSVPWISNVQPSPPSRLVRPEIRRIDGGPSTFACDLFSGLVQLLGKPDEDVVRLPAPRTAPRKSTAAPDTTRAAEQPVSADTRVVGPPAPVPHAQHADPAAADESEFFREGDVAWWEHSVPANDVAREHAVDDSTTVTTVTTVERPHKRGNCHGRRLSAASSTTSAEDEPRWRQDVLQKRARSRTRRHDSSSSSDAVLKPAAQPARLTAQAISTVPREQVVPPPPQLLTIPRFGERTSTAPLATLPGAPAPAPLLHLHPSAAPLASSSVPRSSMTLLRLPVAPTDVRPAALLQPEEAGEAQRASAPEDARTSSNAAPAAGTTQTAVGAPGSRLTAESTRASDALAHEHPLPPSTYITFGKDGQPMQVSSRAGVTSNTNPVLSASEEAAFGRYVQFLLTQSLLQGDPTRATTVDLVPRGRDSAAPKLTTVESASQAQAQIHAQNLASLPSAASLEAGMDVAIDLHHAAANALFAAAEASLRAAATSNATASPTAGAAPRTERSGLSAIDQARLVQDAMDQRGRVLSLATEVNRLRAAESALAQNVARQQRELASALQSSQPQQPPAPTVVDAAVSTEKAGVLQAATSMSGLPVKPTREGATTQTDTRPSSPVKPQPAASSYPSYQESRATALVADLNNTSARISATLQVADAMDSALARSHRLLADMHRTARTDPISELSSSAALSAVTHHARSLAVAEQLHQRSDAPAESQTAHPAAVEAARDAAHTPASALYQPISSTPAPSSSATVQYDTVSQQPHQQQLAQDRHAPADDTPGAAFQFASVAASSIAVAPSAAEGQPQYPMQSQTTYQPSRPTSVYVADPSYTSSASAPVLSAQQLTAATPQTSGGQQKKTRAASKPQRKITDTGRFGMYAAGTQKPSPKKTTPSPSADAHSHARPQSSQRATSASRSAQVAAFSERLSRANQQALTSRNTNSQQAGKRTASSSQSQREGSAAAQRVAEFEGRLSSAMRPTN